MTFSRFYRIFFGSRQYFRPYFLTNRHFWEICSNQSKDLLNPCLFRWFSGFKKIPSDPNKSVYTFVAICWLWLSATVRPLHLALFAKGLRSQVPDANEFCNLPTNSPLFWSPPLTIADSSVASSHTRAFRLSSISIAASLVRLSIIK